MQRLSRVGAEIVKCSSRTLLGFAENNRNDRDLTQE